MLKGFDVVNQLVQWRVELKDPSQLASISQQGITRDALRELTQPITPAACSLTASTHTASGVIDGHTLTNTAQPVLGFFVSQ